MALNLILPSPPQGQFTLNYTHITPRFTSMSNRKREVVGIRLTRDWGSAWPLMTLQLLGTWAQIRGGCSEPGQQVLNQRYHRLGSENLMVHPRGRSRVKTRQEQCWEECEEGHRSLKRSEGAQAGWLSGGTGLTGDERGAAGGLNKNQSNGRIGQPLQIGTQIIDNQSCKGG